MTPQELREKIERVLRNRILFIGEKIPNMDDENDKSVYTGNPQQMVDELFSLLQEHTREMVEKTEEFLKGELGYQGKFIEPIKPKHGLCCTCQECGQPFYGDCVCQNNRIYKFLQAIKSFNKE